MDLYRECLGQVVHYLGTDLLGLPGGPEESGLPQLERVLITAKLQQILVRGLSLDYSLTLQLIKEYNYIVLINLFTDNLWAMKDIGHSLADCKLLIVFILDYFNNISKESQVCPTEEPDDLVSQFELMKLD